VFFYVKKFDVKKTALQGFSAHCSLLRRRVLRRKKTALPGSLLFAASGCRGLNSRSLLLASRFLRGCILPLLVAASGCRFSLPLLVAVWRA